MSEITIRPADGWKSVGNGYEIRVQGGSAVALDVMHTGSCLVVGSSWHTDGERWTRYVDAISGDPDVLVWVGRGYAIWLRRR